MHDHQPNSYSHCYRDLQLADQEVLQGLRQRVTPGDKMCGAGSGVMLCAEWPRRYCSFPYSALASFKTGMSGIFWQHKQELVETASRRGFSQKNSI